MNPPMHTAPLNRGKGRVTGVISQNNISVDGMLDHILNVHMVVTSSDNETGDDRQEEDDGQQGDETSVKGPLRSLREQRPPRLTSDYEMA